MPVQNNASVGIALSDLAVALLNLRNRPQFPLPVPDFIVQARRLVVRTEHGDVWITPGLVRAADDSWRRTLAGTALDRASRTVKTIHANFPSTPEGSSSDDGDEEPDLDLPEAPDSADLVLDGQVRGLVLGGASGSPLFALKPCCDATDLTLDVTPLVVRDGVWEALPERPLCSDGIVALASWLSGVVDGLVAPGDTPLVVCGSMLFALDKADDGFAITAFVYDEPEGPGDEHVCLTVRASRAQVRASAEWWQRRAAGHLGQLI